MMKRRQTLSLRCSPASGIAGWWCWLLVLLHFCSSAVAAWSNPVQIIILAGDDAAEGYASIHSLKDLVNDPDTKSRYSYLVDDSSLSSKANETVFATVENVFVTYDHYRTDDWIFGPLTVENGRFASSSTKFGPELQMGHVLASTLGTPVVLVKAAWPSRTLAQDFRPPSSDRTGFQYYRLTSSVSRTIANLEQILQSGSSHGKQNQQKQHDLLQHFRRHGHVVSGVVWFHGYSDLKKTSTTPEEAASVISEYRFNLINLLRDLQWEYPLASFVLAELGGRGQVNVSQEELDFRSMQLSVRDELTGKLDTDDDMDDDAKYDLYVDVAYARTAIYVREDLPSQGGDYDRYYGRADTMIDIGDALASTLVEVMYANGIMGSESSILANFMAYTAEGPTKMLLVLAGIAVCVCAVVACCKSGRLNARTLNDGLATTVKTVNRFWFMPTRILQEEGESDDDDESGSYEDDDEEDSYDEGYDEEFEDEPESNPKAKVSDTPIQKEAVTQNPKARTRT